MGGQGLFGGPAGGGYGYGGYGQGQQVQQLEQVCTAAYFDSVLLSIFYCVGGLTTFDNSSRDKQRRTPVRSINRKATACLGMDTNQRLATMLCRHRRSRVVPDARSALWVPAVRGPRVEEAGAGGDQRCAAVFA